MDVYEFCLKIAGEYFCSLNNGVPVTNVEKSVVRSMAGFGTHLITVYENSKTKPEPNIIDQIESFFVG